MKNVYVKHISNPESETAWSEAIYAKNRVERSDLREKPRGAKRFTRKTAWSEAIYAAFFLRSRGAQRFTRPPGTAP
jgi:hypothetical protein